MAVSARCEMFILSLKPSKQVFPIYQFNDAVSKMLRTKLNGITDIVEALSSRF